MDNLISITHSRREYPYDNEQQQHLVEVLRDLLVSLGYSRKKPFSHMINSESLIVLKPNWVYHTNFNDKEFLGTCTHPSIIFSIAELIAESINEVGVIVIGDAPIQSCDFSKLLENLNFYFYLNQFSIKYPNIKVIIEDWRLKQFKKSTKNVGISSINIEEKTDINGYLLVNTGTSSLLEEISQDSDKFRVTCYPPSKMMKHHKPGVHEYLLVEKPLKADLFINIPKFKTHKKTGLTGALKNIVGLNGHKEYLPHHRQGSPVEGGDCYPNSNYFRRLFDRLYDHYWENINVSPHFHNFFKSIALNSLWKSSRIIGGSKEDAGSWSGNDTIWRTVLDLNNIIYFGELKPKHILSIVDGLIAGEGEGPLDSIPKSLGILIGSQNPLLVDYVIAKIIGYDISKIPLIFQGLNHQKSNFSSIELESIYVNVIENDKTKKIKITDIDIFENFKIPLGWMGSIK